MKEQCPLLKQEITAFFELVSEDVYIQCKWSWGLLQRWTKHTYSQEAYNFLRKMRQKSWKLWETQQYYGNWGKGQEQIYEEDSKWLKVLALRKTYQRKV